MVTGQQPASYINGHIGTQLQKMTDYTKKTGVSGTGLFQILYIRERFCLCYFFFFFFFFSLSDGASVFSSPVNNSFTDSRKVFFFL